MSTYPTWDQRATYLSDAQTAMAKVAVDVAADTTNVWQSIDETIAALHLLRQAAGSEQMRRHDAMVARMEAEEAERAARPAEPSPEVVAKAQQMVDLGHPVLARLELWNHTSMSLAARTAFVENLTKRAGTREGVSTP
jgi:hypothetical protein